MTAEATMVADAWRALGGARRRLRPVRVHRSTGLQGLLPVGELAIGAVASQLVAAQELLGRRAAVTIDARHVGFAFRSERYVRLAGRPAGPGFAPLSRFLRTADGWLRLHANYPHHRAAAVAVLGESAPADVAAQKSAHELEAAVVAAGGAAAAVRRTAEWRTHPQGRAVAALPLLDLRPVGEAPRRECGLTALRVVDLTRVIAGPVATRTLASHGADVVRIDSPNLPQDPGALLDTGVGKRHAFVDFATRDGRDTVHGLLEAADVVVQGYRPGALAQWGLDAATLAERHPHLVVVQLSAWGTAGPWRDRRGFDSLVQAATGIADRYASSGTPGQLPAQALDHATGHLAAAAAMRAIHNRRTQGGTWHAWLSLAQTAHWLSSAPAGDPDPALEDDDVGRYLMDLHTAEGPVTVVAPPGSPPWTHGPEPAGATSLGGLRWA